MSARNVHGLIQAQGRRSEEEGDSRAGEESRRQKKSVSSPLSRGEEYVSGSAARNSPSQNSDHGCARSLGTCGCWGNPRLLLFQPQAPPL